MSFDFSRRQLADYVVSHLVKGRTNNRLASNLAAALVASKNQKELDLLVDDVARELEERGLLAHVKVVTATPLSDYLRQQLKNQIKKATGVKDVILEETIDKSVIGGLRVETAAHRWEKTVARQLARIKGGI